MLFFGKKVSTFTQAKKVSDIEELFWSLQASELEIGKALARSENTHKNILEQFP